MDWGSGNRVAQRKSSVGQRIACVLFGLVFFAFGAGFMYLIVVRPVMGVVSARHWRETPCRILSSEVKTHRGSKDTTYSVKISYAYWVDGRQYTSSRYDFMGGSSSGRQGKAEIVSRYPPGTETICYVDPHDPAQAVLYRGLSSLIWFGLLPLLFMLIGGGVMVAGFWKPKPSVALEAPWLARADWAVGRVKSEEKSSFVTTWVFALFWNALAWPAVFVARDELTKDWKGPVLLVLLFPIVGIGLLAAAVYATMRWRKFGESIFEMASVPGVVGGALEGRICLRQPVRPETGFKLKLQCIRRYVTGGGKNRRTSESLIWEGEHDSGGAGATDTVSVLFAIPADVPETNGENRNDEILWRLSAKARLPGVDYAVRFVVPVFKVAQTSAQATAAERARTASQAAIAQYQQPATSRIRVTSDARGRREFYFPAARNPGAAAGGTVFFIVWIGLIWLQVHLKFPVFFPIVTGLMGVLIFYGVLSLWFNSSRVVALPDGITVMTGIIGRTRTIPAADIARVTTKPGMAFGTKIYRDVKVILRSGREVTAGSGIADAREAEWLAAEMARPLNLP